MVCLENSLSSMQGSDPRQEQLNRLEIYMLELEKKLSAALEAMRVVEGVETMECHGIKLESSRLSNWVYPLQSCNAGGYSIPASQELVLNTSGHRTVRQPEFEYNV